MSAVSANIGWWPRSIRKAGIEGIRGIVREQPPLNRLPKCALKQTSQLSSLMSGAVQEAALGQAEGSIFSTRSQLGLLLD
ncbi:hypothetical protein D3I60_14515 [Brevibacterium permense]|nr:hypothetical protein [Brevibacterium permense]